MFFRVISAVIFSVAGAVTGIAFSERLKSKLEICRDIREVFITSAMLIRCRAVDVYTLTAELKESPRLFRLTFLKEIPDTYGRGENFHSMWKNAVNSQKNIPDDEKILLCDFGDLLGKSDTEGQTVFINSLAESAGILEKRRYREYQEKGRLYRSVGMLFGVMIGILVI